MKMIQPDEYPFKVHDAALAFCLHMAGIPFADVYMPCTNSYDEPVLFKIGGGEEFNGKVTKQSRYKGMTVEQGARAAMSERPPKKGILVYHFKSSQELGLLLNAYKDQVKELDRDAKMVKDIIDRVEAGTLTVAAAAKQLEDMPPASDRLKEIMESVGAGAMMLNEAVLRISCINLRLRGDFMNIWKGRLDLALFKEPNQGASRTRDVTGPNGKGEMVKGKEVISPGFRVLSLNASPETKRKFKL